MTIFYPDVSSFQAGISLAGTVACFAKATEGTTYISSDYARAKADAAAHGVIFGAYHFIHQGAAAAQAAHAHNVVGNATPLMVDFEPTSGSNPTVGDCTAFVDAYRALGGTVRLVYLPKWYWGQTSLAELRGHANRGIIGRRSQRVAPPAEEVVPLTSPSLSSLSSRGLALVSSDYTTYSDTGPGWASYGGMTPEVWQYTDAFAFNGHTCDFNAYRGTVAQFATLISGPQPAPAPAPDPVPVPSEEDTMGEIPADGQYAAISIPSSHYTWIAFFADPSRQGKQPQALRVAVHYYGHDATSFSTIENITVDGAKTTVKFNDNTADGISVERSDDAGNWVPVGYNIG